MQEESAELRGQIERLEAARRDPALIALVPRVVAAGFGAIPLGQAGGALEVAVAESASPAAVAALGRVLGRPVVPVPFGDALIQVYLRRIYLKDDTLNFHTFIEEDFLEREECLRLLREEKEHEPVRPHLHPDPARVALLDFAYRSVLHNLDARAAPAPFAAGETDLAFRPDPEGGGALLYRREDLPLGVLIVAQESFSYEGIEHAHGWRTHEVRKLPHMIHPTELQIVGIEPDGTLHFYVYDRVERVRPGEPPRRLDVTYHFLSAGQRYRRRLSLKVYGIYSVPRARLRRTVDPITWEPEHLARWLGFDLAEEAADERR